MKKHIKNLYNNNFSVVKSLICLVGVSIVFAVMQSCQHKTSKMGDMSYETIEEEAYYDMPAEKKELKAKEDNGDDEVHTDFNTEEYDRIYENPFKDAMQNPLSTFSIDVDNAAYSNVRRFLNQSQMPPPDAVRIEEMINYFTYDYPRPQGEHPFAFVTELAECPWNKENKLVHIGIQGKSLDYENIKPCNLVFLVDASGSMKADNKLPLLKKALGLLLDELSDEDRIAVVAYAGAAGLVIESTPATEKKKILKAINKLSAGGSTAGGEGVELAYKVAKENLVKGGNNRVILATDGDFNVGTSSTGDLVRMIEEKRKDGIYLTICGFGMGNYKDGRMEQISNAGNGNYFYIDNIREAEKVFVKEMRANMFTIAKDVKIQVEFNPAKVKGYRLIGYENRVMANEDFDDDTKDAGELGAGHTVTALYEIIPVGSGQEVQKSADLNYQTTEISESAKNSPDILTLKFRYKPIDSETSILVETPVKDENNPLDAASDNFKFSAAVAGFGMILRELEYKGSANFENMQSLASESASYDENGYKSEFVQLVKTASLLANSNEE